MYFTVSEAYQKRSCGYKYAIKKIFKKVTFKVNEKRWTPFLLFAKDDFLILKENMKCEPQR